MNALIRNKGTDAYCLTLKIKIIELSGSDKEKWKGNFYFVYSSFKIHPKCIKNIENNCLIKFL